MLRIIGKYGEFTKRTSDDFLNEFAPLYKTFKPSKLPYKRVDKKDDFHMLCFNQYSCGIVLFDLPRSRNFTESRKLIDMFEDSDFE